MWRPNGTNYWNPHQSRCSPQPLLRFVGWLCQGNDFATEPVGRSKDCGLHGYGVDGPMGLQASTHGLRRSSYSLPTSQGSRHSLANGSAATLTRRATPSPTSRRTRPMSWSRLPASTH